MDAVEGKGPQRRPQRRLDGRLEGVAKAVGGGYCRSQMPLKLALGVGGTVAGRRLGGPEEGGGGTLPFSNASLGGGGGHVLTYPVNCRAGGALCSSGPPLAVLRAARFALSPEPAPWHGASL